MYRVKTKVLGSRPRSRNPALLIASTITVAAAGNLSDRSVHCQRETDIQEQAEQLKEHVQDFTDNVLEMADSPYDSQSSATLSATPSSSSGRGRGHGSSYFSSMGPRTSDPRSHQHHGWGARDSVGDQTSDHRENYYGEPEGKLDKFRGPYVEEPLIPALFYITVAGLTGSIIARKSNVAFRFLSPVALALGASAYCIPRTTNNVIHGVRTFDYQEWSRELQHKYDHAKKSLVDTTHGLASAAGSVAHGAKDAAHGLSEKTHGLSDKTQKALKGAKDKTVEAAHDFKEKGNEVVNEVKHKAMDLGHELENKKDQVKDKVVDKTDLAKDWWNSETKRAEKAAQDLKRSAHDIGEDARDWARGAKEDTQDWFRGKQRYHGRTHGFDPDDRFKSKAQQGWESTWDDLQDRGRDWRRQVENLKDSSQDWAQDRSRELRGQFEEMKGGGQEWTRDRRRDAQRFDHEAESHWYQAREEAKRIGREARDFSEHQFSDAKRNIRNGVEDLQDRGRQQARKFERDFEDARSRSRSADRETGGAVGTARGLDAAGWGYGRPREDYGGRRSRLEERDEYSGRSRGVGGDRFDYTPRRSVTEAAKEGKHWWHREATGFPYERDDDNNNFSNSTDRSASSSWWKTGTSVPKDDVRDRFEHAKDQFQRGADHLKDSVEDKAVHGRAWFADKSNELKGSFEQGKHRTENELHSKLARPYGAGYRDEQGRDFYGGLGPGGGHNHASFFSDDNWFHYDHGEDNRSFGGRARERGL
ncbi:hypothetical protein BGX28_009248 [Mortierella sp. GBA30]|nr:hypothetical protein BGX28_009248 [Mortierella sp. GBA30]